MTDREERYARFVAGLLELHDRHPFSVTSWWRTLTHHRSLADGASASQHLVGTAVDVIFDPGTEPDPGALIALAREYGIEAIPEGDHWHLEWATHVY